MLIIQNNEKLKELAKFGFEPRHNEMTGKIVRYIKTDNRNVIRYIDNDYNHNPYWELSLQDDDLLYDLIKADLITKI